jgi:trans-aconitate methyltransferase
MNKSYFDAYAADYDAELNKGLVLTGESKTYFSEQRIMHMTRCLKKLKIEVRRAIDLGCGTGTATPYFFKHLPLQSLLGLDISKQSLEMAAASYNRYHVDFQEVSAFCPAGDMDLVFCNGVFHHIPPAERPQALELVLHALRPGGIFAFWENNMWNPGTRLVMSRVPFDRDAITITATQARRLLRENGFQVLRTDYLFIFPRLLRMFRPLELRLCRLPLGAQYQVLCQKPQLVGCEVNRGS